MIYDTSKTIMNNGVWKYEGLAKWKGEDNSFRTNSKHQYYELKNGKISSFRLIKTIVRNYKKVV